MRQVQRTSGPRRGLLALLVLVVTAVVGLTGCANRLGLVRDIPGGGSQASPASVVQPSQSRPLGDAVQCPDPNFPEVLAVPETLLGILQACANGTGGTLLTNVSPIAFQVQPIGYTSVTRSVRRSDAFRDLVNAELAAQESTRRVVVVPPGGYTVAVNDGDTALVSVRVEVRHAMEAYSTSLLAQYIESRLTSQPERLVQTAGECARETARVWAQTEPRDIPLDQLLAETMFGRAFSCGRLIRSVSHQSASQPPIDESALAREFRRFSSDVSATAFYDFAQFGRDLVRLSP